MTKRSIVLLILALAFPTTSATGNGCPAPCSGQVTSPPDTRLLFVQPSGARGPVHAYDTKSGRRAFRLPAGVASASGLWHISARKSAATTWVTAYFLPRGEPVRSWPIRGRWAVAGVAPSGRWIALVRHRTEIRIVDRDRGRIVHGTTLRGNFEVEALSADGRRLFLVQHLDSRRYLVRLFDVERARLKTQALRASGAGAPMVGYAWNGIASPDGRWLLTLYLNTRHNHAFVHALDIANAKAACVDLPSGHGTIAPLKSYMLTLSPDRRTLFAANPAIGVVATLDLRTLRTTRVARFTPSAAARPSRSMLAGTISRDGRTVYFSDGRDLWAFDAAYNRVRGPYRTGVRLAGFGFGAGDRTVHALRNDGKLVTFDAATGRRLR